MPTRNANQRTDDSSEESPWQRRVYLDYAATSPMLESAQRAMRAAESEAFGNASSNHWAGTKAHEVLDAARQAVLKRAGVGGRVIFTGGATESNLIGLVGAALARGYRRVVMSAVEHESVHAAGRVAEMMGMMTGIVPVDYHGRVKLDDLALVLKEGPAAVAIMHANNEVGTVQPIRDAACVVHAAGGSLHVDAAQTFCKIPLADLSEADTVSLSAHKIGGPKGVGGLLVREGVDLVSPLGGGSQEFGLRHGTENIPGIAGFARAAVDSVPETVGPALRQRARALMKAISDEIGDIRWTGDLETRTPHIVSCIIPNVPGELLVSSLSALGIAASVGSACHASGTGQSQVLRAMGAATSENACALRLSVGLGTTQDDIQWAAALIGEAVARLRSIVQSGWIEADLQEMV